MFYLNSILFVSLFNYYNLIIYKLWNLQKDYQYISLKNKTYQVVVISFMVSKNYYNVYYYILYYIYKFYPIIYFTYKII